MTQIIKVPDELRGQKIVPFIEFLDVKKINKYVLPYNAWNGNDTIYLGTKKYQELRDFYSQPFSVDMLIGNNRLFEGWEIDKQSGVYRLTEDKYIRVFINVMDNIVLHIGNNYTYPKFLNDFITLCQLADVDLGVWK